MASSNVVRLRTPAAAPAPTVGTIREYTAAQDRVSGLYIRERWLQDGTSSKTYFYRYDWYQTKPKISLGPCNAVSEEQAVTMTKRYAALIKQGINPRDQHTAERDTAENGVYTFERACQAWLDRISSGYKNAKNAAQTAARLRELYPVLGKLPVAAITVDDVARALHPVWTTRYPTAIKTMGYVYQVFLQAIAAKKRPDNINPAAKDILIAAKLPRLTEQQMTERPMPAVDWEDIPKFWKELSTYEGDGADALRFVMLTVQRAGQLYKTTLSQFDFAEANWSFMGEDAAKTKMGIELRIPLGPVSLKLAQDRAALIAARPSDEPVGKRRLFPISDMTMARVLETMGYAGPNVAYANKVTAHGMRSAFKTWYEENMDTIGISNEKLSEAQLSHTQGKSKLDAKYNRGEKLRLRRILMTRWEQYVTTGVI